MKQLKNIVIVIIAFVTTLVVGFVGLWMLPDSTSTYVSDDTEITTAMTTTTTTDVTTITTTVTSTTTATTIDTTLTTTTDVTTTDPSKYLNYIGEFTGKYYHGDYNPCFGGSGRMLEDCTPKSGEMKGSVACRRIFEDYGYTVNGRTRVYLEFESYPEMNGWYFVDDCCQSMNVVDVYFIDYATCPWQNDGVTDIHLWMEVS